MKTTSQKKRCLSNATKHLFIYKSLHHVKSSSEFISDDDMAGNVALTRSRLRNGEIIGTKRRQVTTAAIRARWCIDIRYGKKLDAVALLQDWAMNIGREALPALDASNTRINSGAVGSPEARLELEITFETLSELEQFWASIPAESHKSWSQKMQAVLIDGSPTWEVFRTVEAFPQSLPGGKESVDGQSKDNNAIKSSDVMKIADEGEIAKYGQGLDETPSLPRNTETTPSGLSVITDEEDAQIVLDWKGEPMKVNPGDKLPFKF